MDAADRAYLDEVWDLTYQAIGRMVVASGWLEQSLRELYGRLLQSPAAAVVVPGLNFAWLHDAVKAVLTVITVEDESDIRSALVAAKVLWDQRNSIVHAGAWYSGVMLSGPGIIHGDPAEKRHLTTMSKRGRAEPQSREWTAKEIDVLAKELHDVRGRLDLLAQDLD